MAKNNRGGFKEETYSLSDVPPVTPQPLPKDPLVERLEVLFENYKKILEAKRVSRREADRAASLLKDATQILLENGTQDLWNTFLQFHRDNEKGVCKETIALQGLFSIKNEKIKNRISFVYYALRGIVRNSPRKLNQAEFLHSITQGDHTGKKIEGVKIWNCYKRSARIK